MRLRADRLNTVARAIATSPVRGHLPKIAVSNTDGSLALDNFSGKGGVMGSAALAGSPLFLTDLDAPMYFAEIQFVLSGPLNGLFERIFETEGGPLFLNGVFFMTLLRMGYYYGFAQPSYLWHFQE